MVHAYSGYSGLNLTVRADCGPAAPLEDCDDGVDNDGDSAVDCADADCDADPACAPPAEECDDGVDNDEDGDTDCDDADCDADPACAPPPWTQLSTNNFETNLGPYTDGGVDAARVKSSHSHQGNWSVELRDNSDAASSFYSTNGINLTGYDDLQVDFWFKARSFETSEDFYVELWNGSSWVVIGRFVRGTDFANNNYYHPVVTVSRTQVAFTAAAKLRFRADASADDDTVYIDEVIVSAR